MSYRQALLSFTKSLTSRLNYNVIKRGHPLKGTGQEKKDLQYKKIILLTLSGYRISTLLPLPIFLFFGSELTVPVTHLDLGLTRKGFFLVEPFRFVRTRKSSVP